MTIFENLLLKSLGFGGVVGAAIKLVTSIDDISRSITLFSTDLEAALVGRQDASADTARQSLSELKTAYATVGASLAELRRALRI